MSKKSLMERHVFVSLLVLAGITSGERRGEADAPPGRYSITGGGTSTGTVLDTKTGLTWQQAVPTSTYAWAGASTYCTSDAEGLPGSGWRLPSMQELETIVDDSRQNPSIDPTAFPGTPTEYFWTSTIYATDSASAWIVDFHTGQTQQPAQTATYRVRCVR